MKRLLISLSLFVVIVLTMASFVLYRTMNTQGDLHFEDQSFPRAFFPMSRGMIEMFDSTLFLVDTGSSYSTINRSTLRKLKEMGMEIEQSNVPIFGRGSDNRMHWSTEHYIVTLPTAEYKLRYDSVSQKISWLPTGRIHNYIKNVSFAVTEDSVLNTLGMDILEDFILEYQYFRGALVLRTRVEENYQHLSDLSYPHNWENLYGSAHRYYVPISVDNGKFNSYLIDTGISRLCIKIPIGDSIKSKRTLADDSYHNGQRVDRVKTAPNAWVKMGRRAGSHSVYYAPYNVEGHSFNPLIFFNQDVAFDFKKQKMYLRPFALLGFPKLAEDSVSAPITSYYKFVKNNDF